MSDAMKVDLPYIMQDVDRHGNVRVYVRMRGRPKVRISEPPGTPAFLRAYEKAVEALRAGAPAQDGKPVAKGTLEWLGRQYAASHDFRRLDARSQRVRLAILESCFAEPPRPGAVERMGHCPIDRLEPKHIKVLRDRKSATPGAANNRVRALRVMLAWAVEQELVKRNVAAEVRTLSYAKAGFHSWTRDDVRQFEAKHPVGSRARLALALMLFTGARRSDAVLFGRQHVKDGWLSFTPRKTRASTGKALDLPILPELASIIAASPTGDLTFLVTSRGTAFSAASFGNWFRKRCDEAGLPHCSAHGLRKAGAVIAAENGATEKELMAIFGWETAKLAAHYTKKASQKRLAGRAMRLIVPQTED